jgi:hypothetical protein
VSHAKVLAVTEFTSRKKNQAHRQGRRDPEDIVL